MMARLVVLLVLAGGCASGRGNGGANGDGRVDAPTGTSVDAAPGDGAATADARVDGSPMPIDAPGGGGGGGLDPDLELPDPSGQFCDEPRRRGAPECPPLEVCRFFTSTEGRCEAGPASGGTPGSPCTATDQCDIQSECYQDRCTAFCLLGSLECGMVADCINIGHATQGVCRP
jgi:hypothetical protein